METQKTIYPSDLPSKKTRSKLKQNTLPAQLTHSLTQSTLSVQSNQTPTALQEAASVASLINAPGKQASPYQIAPEDMQTSGDFVLDTNLANTQNGPSNYELH